VAETRFPDHGVVVLIIEKPCEDTTGGDSWTAIRGWSGPDVLLRKGRGGCTWSRIMPAYKKKGRG